MIVYKIYINFIKNVGDQFLSNNARTTDRNIRNERRNKKVLSLTSSV